jgi:hypothetical protein
MRGFQKCWCGCIRPVKNLKMSKDVEGEEESLKSCMTLHPRGPITNKGVHRGRDSVTGSRAEATTI